MLNIFAKSFMTATGHDTRTHREGGSHYPPNERFDTRRRAEIEAHKLGLPR